MHTIHHHQPDCVCGLSAVCVCVCTCMVRVGELSIVGELLLSWQGWVLIGTPSEWYECRCHSENSTDRPTLIHSYGELLSPEGLQIIKAFTTLNTHASHSLTDCACVFVCVYVSHTSVFMYLLLHVLSFHLKDLSNIFSLPILIWQLDCLNIRVLLFWLEITISMQRGDSTLAAECIYVSLVSIMHAYEYVYHYKSLGCYAWI